MILNSKQMLTELVSTDLFLFLSRLILGSVMIRYGFPKIKNLKENAKDFSKMGFKPGILWGTPMALLEFFGGIGMILGIYPEIAALLFGFMMLVGTIWKIKIKKSYGTISYDMSLFILSGNVIFFGSGEFNLFNYQIPQLQYGMLLGAVLFAFIMAFLPEILGEKYRKWKA
jgi:putative oxidoreductase